MGHLVGGYQLKVIMNLTETHLLGAFLFRQLQVGCHFVEYAPPRCRQGKLNPYEHIVEGFENLPKTFIEQLEGKSQGKVIVRTG